MHKTYDNLLLKNLTPSLLSSTLLIADTPADKREFVKISQAVGFGFLIMGAIGYVIKLGE